MIRYKVSHWKESSRTTNKQRRRKIIKDNDKIISVMHYLKNRVYNFNLVRLMQLYAMNTFN